MRIEITVTNVMSCSNVQTDTLETRLLASSGVFFVKKKIQLCLGSMEKEDVYVLSREKSAFFKHLEHKKSFVDFLIFNFEEMDPNTLGKT